MDVLRIKEYWLLYLWVLLLTLCVAFWVVAFVTVVNFLKVSEASGCKTEKQQLAVVADITNKTGQFPDGNRLKTGETVSVNPEYCK